MAHLNINRPHYTAPLVAAAWLPATAAATQLAIKIAARTDIAVKLGPGFAAAAGTAMFTPHIATIEVDTDVMLPGVAPEDVQPHDSLFRARHGLFMGAVTHEAAHARFTKWLPIDLYRRGFTKRKVDVLVALEESRIEYKIIPTEHASREYLGHIVLDLIGKDFTLSDSKYGASIGAALLLARVDAGSLTATEGKKFRDVLGRVLDDDTLNTLQGLWREYHLLNWDHETDVDYEVMDSIATRWIEALGMDASDEGEEELSCPFAHEGDPGGGSGGSEGSEGASGASGEGSEGEGTDSLAGELKDAVEDAKHERSMRDAKDVGSIKHQRRMAEREADIERKRRGKKFEEAAFPKIDAEHGKSGESWAGGSSFTWRDPNSGERAAGMHLSRLFQKVIYTDRGVTKVRREVPGGRLHTRGAMQRTAQRKTRQRPTAPAWEVTKRTTTDEPKMRVGVMLDVSGSMTAQARIASSLSYIVGNAVERNDGDFGMVLFGNEAKGVYRPGQKVDKVVQVNPYCGREAFMAGFNSIDSLMDLVDSEGLRVLIMISDGVFVTERDANYADAVLPMLAKAGVVVLHVDVDGVASRGGSASFNPRHNNPLAPVVVGRGDDPVKVAQMIGEHLIGLVKKSKRSRAAA